MDRLAFLVAVAMVLSGGSVEATQQGQGALIKWKQMDVCAREAQAAYPDNNAESNAKRDAKLKECLSAYGLPPRQPSTGPGSQ